MCQWRNYPEGEQSTRVACLDPQALAWEWLTAYLENLNDQINEDDEYDSSKLTMEELINTAKSHLDGGWGDYIVRGGSFEGQSTDPVFWDKLADLLEIEIPHQQRSNFFSCSC